MLLLIMIVAIASVTVTTTISLLLSKTSNLTVPSLGTIKTIGVEVYWDPKCENKTEEIDWGTIWVGFSTTKQLYIKSVSNFKVTLELNEADWKPANISDYIYLSWDYNGTSLDPGDVINVNMTLSVSFSKSFVLYLVANDVKDFSVDIHIVASESEHIEKLGTFSSFINHTHL